MDNLDQLARAREQVESDLSLCPMVVEGMLPIVDNELVQIRKWCSLFFLDAFTIFDQPRDTLMDLAVKSLDALLKLLKDDDITILKNTIMTASTVYPLGFLYYCENPQDATTWSKLELLKQTCNELWDQYQDKEFGIEAACIKFAQQVVKTQTEGSRDPRLAGENDVSLTLIPDDHPLKNNVRLEAEASGLLDKILGIFIAPEIYAPKVTCAIHAVNVLMRTRRTKDVRGRIFKTIFNFDSSKKRAKSGISDQREEMEFKFIDKALKLLLGPLIRTSEFKHLAPQINNYLSTLSQGRASEKLKRRLAESQEDVSHKRVKLERSTTPVNSSTSMPSGPVSYTSLFNLLASDDPSESFDVKELPPDIVVNIAFAGIAAVNDQLLRNSKNVVEQRLKNLAEQAPLQSTTDQYPIDTFDQDDDNAVSGGGNNVRVKGEHDIDLVDSDDDDDDEANLLPASEFTMPEPEKMSAEQKVKTMNDLIDRLISYGSVDAADNVAAATNKTIDRVAVSSWQKDTWIIFASRLLTRGVCTNSGLETEIREHIYRYVMTNYRERLETLLTWLTEEWYNEFVVKGLTPEQAPESNYYIYAGKLLDTIIPLTEANNIKSFLRLLSDLPELNYDLISKLRTLCIDPDRMKLGFKGLQFLIMLRPPCREPALDLVQNLYGSEDEDAKAQAKLLLQKYRPDVVS